MTLMNFLQLAGGFIYLLMGADLLVRGSVGLARRAGVPPIVVALTLVALGTSLPELVVSVQAVIQGYPGIVMGNVVGSNIANVLLVGGMSAMVYPLAFPGGSVRRDALVMLLATILFYLLCLTTAFTRPVGVALLLGLVAFMVPTVKEVAQASDEVVGPRAPLAIVLGLPTRRPVIALFIMAGVIGLPLGSRLVVDSAVVMAARMGISEAVVGVTIIAFSTSLPELATTLVAAVRKETEVALGTLVGSNIFNILGIIGISALVAPEGIPVPPIFPYLDLPVMLLSALLVSAFLWRRQPIARKAGIVFFTLYVGYLAALFVFGQG